MREWSRGLASIRATPGAQTTRSLLPPGTTILQPRPGVGPKYYNHRSRNINHEQHRRADTRTGARRGFVKGIIPMDFGHLVLVTRRAIRRPGARRSLTAPLLLTRISPVIPPRHRLCKHTQ